ncbi:hypothetical protein HY797_02320 [Candidatus Falkowbacteria bacterium]|nr:hypothetical protein [Candidatus Falkowbacteria bacterium]
MEKEKQQLDITKEKRNKLLSRSEEIESEELLLDDVQENAVNARQEIKQSHSVWENMPGEVEDYIKSRQIEAEEEIKKLLDKQSKEREDILLEQNKKSEEVKMETREKLRKFFLQTLEQLRQTSKKVLGVIPDTQKLIDNLDISKDLEKNPAGKNLISALNIAGGIRSYSVEKGIIDDGDERENSGFKKIIGGVNSFLEKNEESKIWLQDVIRLAIYSKK